MPPWGQQLLDMLSRQGEVLTQLQSQIATISATIQAQQSAQSLFWSKDWPEITDRVKKLEDTYDRLVHRDELRALANELEGMKKAVYGGMAIAALIAIVVPIFIARIF